MSDLWNLPTRELKELAKKRGIRGCDSLGKEDLINLLNRSFGLPWYLFPLRPEFGCIWLIKSFLFVILSPVKLIKYCFSRQKAKVFYKGGTYAKSSTHFACNGTSAIPFKVTVIDTRSTEEREEEEGMARMFTLCT